MALSKSEIATIVNSEINIAQGFDDDQTSSNRRKALDYYFGRPRPDDETGHSLVQSLDVADMTEAVMANMMPAFASDNLAAFEPDSQEDTQQADIESQVVSNYIMERNRGYVQITEAVKDALLLRNGLMKCWVEDTVEIRTVVLENVDEVSASLALRPDPGEERELLSADKTGEDELIDARIRITKTTRDLRITSTDPTFFLVNQDHDSIFLDLARFQAERSYPTRTDLIVRGFDKKLVDGLPATSHDAKTDTVARRRDADQVGRRGSQFDRSEETIELYECYIRIDADEDGESELHRIFIAGQKVLDDDIVEFPPWVSGTALLNPHQYSGISLYDVLKNIQDIKTYTLRQWLDNLEGNNNLTTVVLDGSVNMEDALETRASKVIRARSLDAVKEIPIADLGSSSQALLEYADKMRSERGGASLDLQSAQAQLQGDTAHGIERQFTSREQLAAMMTRTMSETLIRGLYILVHRTLRTQMPGEVVTRIAGEFATVDPAEWQPRDRLNVKSGMSLGERAHKSQVLNQVMQQQGQLLGGGMDGVLVSLQTYHNAVMDWGKSAGLDNPERYYIDPNSQAAQEAAKGKQQQAQASSDKEEQLNQMIFGMQNQIEQQKVANDKAAEQAEIQFKYFSEAVMAAIAEAKIIGKATGDLANIEAQARLKAVETSGS